LKSKSVPLTEQQDQSNKPYEDGMKRDYQNFVNKVKVSLKAKNPALSLELITPINEKIVSKIASEAVNLSGTIIDSSVFVELANYMDINFPSKKVSVYKPIQEFYDNNGIESKFARSNDLVSKANLVFYNAELLTDRYKSSLLKAVHAMSLTENQKIIYFTTKDTVKNFYQWLGVKLLKEFVKKNLSEYDTDEKVNALVKRLFGVDKLDATYLTSKVGLQESPKVTTPSKSDINQELNYVPYKELPNETPKKPDENIWQRWSKEQNAPKAESSSTSPLPSPSPSIVPETAASPFENILSSARNLFSYSPSRSTDMGYYAKVYSTSDGDKKKWGLIKDMKEKTSNRFAYYDNKVYRIKAITFKKGQSESSGLKTIELYEGPSVDIASKSISVLGDIRNRFSEGFTFIPLTQFTAQAAADVREQHGSPVQESKPKGAGLLTGGNFTEKFNVTSFEFIGQSGNNKVYNIIVN
jgi:hypothetical protein